jgi:hypothetical protein
MDNTIFYLIGNTAAARLAVAEELAALTGARIVDSQDIYAPIFNLLATQKPADVPDAAWAEVDAVRAAVLKTIETLSPKDWNFVFTHAGIDIPADIGVYRSVRDMAKRRGARFQPVTLIADVPKKLLRFDEADALFLNAREVQPRDAATRIVAAAEAASIP